MKMELKLVKKPSGNPATDAERIRGIMIDQILNGPIKTAVELFEETQESWEDTGDMSVFNPETVAEGGQVVFRILLEGPSATKATLSVWQLLDRGTSVRPMHVSADWLSKTEPRSVLSGYNPGHKRGIWLPWSDGIEPRQWKETVGDLVEPEAILEVGLAAQKALDAVIG